MDAIRKNIVLILQISEPRDLLQSHEKIDQRFTTMLNKFERGETSPVFEEIYLEDFGMTTVERPSPFPQTSFYPVMNPLNYNRFAFHQPLSPIQPPQGSVVQKNDIKVLSDYQQSNQQLKDNHERMLLELTGTANIVFAFQKEIAQKDEKIAEIKNRLETLQTGQAEESSAHSQLELAQSDSIVQQMEKELKILKNESGQLNKKYDSMKQNFHSQITALNLENKELKNQNKMLRTTNKEVNKRYTDVCTTLSDRNRTISDLEKDIKGQNNQIQASEQNQIQSADQISVLTEQLQQAEAKNQQNRLLICAMLVGMLGMLLYNAAALFSGDTVDTSKGLTLNM